MKFRTQLTLFPLCVFFASCIVLSLTVAAWQEMKSLFLHSEQVTEIFEFVDEMQYVLKEYKKSNDLVSLKHLEGQRKFLQHSLNQLMAFPPAQQTLVNSIEMTVRSMARKVYYVIANNEAREENLLKAKKFMLEKLFINMEVIRENSYQLNAYVSQELKAKLKNQLLSVAVALIATTMIMLLLSIRISTRLQSYLNAMNRGLNNVRKGDLESPIKTENKDNKNELGAFIKEFNNLSCQLRETMISRDELQQLIDQKTYSLKKLANTDPLTQVSNRRKLLAEGNNEIERARRYSHALSLLIIDADNFKQINDVHGHYAGDRVLISLCRLFEEEIRTVDVIGRYGGEEFVIVLPETDLSNAREMAERIRVRISGQSLFLLETVA